MDVSKGFTVAVQGAAVGNGATDGWSATAGIRLHVCRPDKQVCGKVTMTESAILWNEKTVLYRSDMSQNKDALRVAWLPSSTGENRQPGFYVWLGDRLIGEALPSMPLSANCWINGAMISTPADLPYDCGTLCAIPGAFAPAL